MFVTDHYKHLSLELGDLTVSIFFMEATGYALAHNRIPVIPLLTVEHHPDAEADSQAIEISMRATVDGAELFNTGPITCPPMKPGQFRPLELHDRTRVPASTTLESSESQPGELSVFVQAGENDRRIQRCGRRGKRNPAGHQRAHLRPRRARLCATRGGDVGAEQSSQDRE